MNQKGMGECPRPLVLASDNAGLGVGAPQGVGAWGRTRPPPTWQVSEAQGNPPPENHSARAGPRAHVVNPVDSGFFPSASSVGIRDNDNQKQMMPSPGGQ